MGKSICKSLIWQRNNITRISSTLKTYEKKSNPVEKWAKDFSRQLSKEELQMVNKSMNKHSAAWVIWTTKRYHVTPFRMVEIQNTKITNAGEEVEERATQRRCWWACTLSGSCEKQLDLFLLFFLFFMLQFYRLRDFSPSSLSLP